MKTTILILSCMLAFGASGQSDSVIYLTVKRSMWFYPKEVSPKRFTLGPGSQISYVKQSPNDYYPAVFERQNGFVEAGQVTNTFQNALDIQLQEPISNTEIRTLQSQADMNIDIMRRAGNNIRNGGRAVILGTIVCIGGGVVAAVMSKDNPKTGYQIGIGAGLVGLAVGIGGMASISTGGGILSNYGGTPRK